MSKNQYLLALGKVFDINGKLVRTLVDRMVEKGYIEVIWDGKNNNGKDVPSGIYYYRLRVGKKVMSKKAVLLR